MRNVARVFVRDVKRIAKVPAAWLVVLFLLVLPSLYTWFNVAGFWDPYGNTSQLRICVVNEDTGVQDSLFGSLDLGAEVEDRLREDHQLGWDFTTRDAAMEALQAGQAYAVIVIPSSFSSDIATLGSADPQLPKLEYYVNEKTGPVSPKITDTGASELDTASNDAFVSQVSEAVAQTIDDAISSWDARVSAAQDDASSRLREAGESLESSRETLAQMSETIDSASAKADELSASLDEAKSRVGALSSALQDIAVLTGEASEGVMGLPVVFSSTLDDATLLLSQSSSKANEVFGQAAADALTAQGNVDAAVSRAEALVADTNGVIDQLTQLSTALPDGEEKDALNQAIALLQQNSDSASALLDEAASVSSSIAGTATSASGASDSVNTAVQDALQVGASFRETLATSTVPTLGAALGDLSEASSGLSAVVSGQQTLIEQCQATLAHLKETLAVAQDACSETDGVLANLIDSFERARIDVTALGSSDALSELLGGPLDSSAVADFMLSPTQVETETLYPLNSYGSAMAPLFINLTLWIGVFMLMVIVRLEVDEGDISDLTAVQRHFGRWLLLALLAAIQACVCCAGCLLMGVQTHSAPLFFLTAVGASQAYLAIQYTLSTLFQHVGKGLCVLLVFVQIPAATGLYPIEMTSPFFQAVYPVFPFTYGINAMREVIGGFYDGAWLSDMAVLAAFFAVALAAGALLRPRLVNLNRLFAGHIQQSGILMGEKVALPPRRFRVGQLLRVLADREEYRLELVKQAQRFFRWYPRIKRGALVAGIAVPVLATVVLSVTQAEKVVLLTLWLVWLVVIIVALIAIEYVREGLQRRAALGQLDDSEVYTLYAASSDRVPAGRSDAGADASGGVAAGEGAEPGMDERAGESECAGESGVSSSTAGDSGEGGQR